MDELLDSRSVKTMARFISVSFLLVHIAMIVLFGHYGVRPMVVFNVGSVIFYVLSFVLIQRGSFALYSTLIYLEVVAHMTAAVLLCGWGADFQVTLVGMSSLAFFAEYLERYLGVRHFPALPLCIVGGLCYLAACGLCALMPAPYTLPAEICLLLRLAWGSIVFIVSTAVLFAFVNEATKSEKALSRRVTHDKLTGLPNRYYVADYLDKLSSAGELDAYWVALADIDDFKHVNDTYGHNCGDFVLRRVAVLLRENLGQALVCRWGGEEFLVVGPIGDGHQREALDEARRVVADEDMRYEEKTLRVTITVGLAAYRTGYTVDEWINVADERLYVGKRSGKNQVVT